MSLNLRQPAGRKVISKTQNSEYIRNLQQQIYLLELETRYMKAGKKGGGIGRSSSQFPSASSNALALDQDMDPDHEESLSEMSRTIGILRDSETDLKRQVEDLKSERDDLQEQLKSQIDKSAADKDQLHGEIIAVKQKQEETAGEVAHLKISYERNCYEKEIMEQELVQLKTDSNSYKHQIQEQLEIHKHIRSSLEKSQSLCHSQQEKIKTLERNFADLNIDLYKKQITDLQSQVAHLTAEIKAENLEKQNLINLQDSVKETMKSAVQKQHTLSQELSSLRQLHERETQSSATKKNKTCEEGESLRELKDTRQEMENEIKMLNISCDAKARSMEELNQKIRIIETAQLKNTEVINCHKEKIEQLETISRNRAHELIQVGQDKGLLQDELAETKNQQARTEKRIKTLTAQNTSLTTKLQQLEHEKEQWKEFSSVIDKVEETGTNYIRMMQGIKSQMRSNIL